MEFHSKPINLQSLSSDSENRTPNFFFIKIYTSYLTAKSLIAAKYVMLRKNIGRFKLPDINRNLLTPSADVEKIIRWADRWIKLFTYKTHQPCYYRAYTLACILRKIGIPVILNVGLRNLRSLNKNRGHCWLTLQGQPIFEDDDEVHLIYPYELVQSSNGINFWMGLNDENYIKRHKRGKSVNFFQ